MVNIIKAQSNDKELLNFILSDDIFQYIIESLEYANTARSQATGLESLKGICSFLDDYSSKILHQIWLVFGAGTDSFRSTCEYIYNHGLVKFIERGLV